jgi:hypothetical protein
MLEDPRKKKVIDANLFLKQLNLGQQAPIVDTNTQEPEKDPWGISDINLDDIFSDNPIQPKIGFLGGINDNSEYRHLQMPLLIDRLRRGK